MQNKEIQEQRIRNYFIEAVRNLVKSEGLRSVNVRSVAAQAGYSYATLYNYFKDLNDLIFITVKDFQDECKAIIQTKTENVAAGKERIRAIAKAYIDYFVEYPSIFELFFIERIRDIGSRTPVAELIYNFLDELCKEDWNFLIQNGMATAEAEQTKSQLRFSTMGMLLFYMNRLQPDNYTDFIQNVNAQLDEILGL